MGCHLALQSSGAFHLGVDNLGVVRHVGRLLDGHHGSVLFELVKMAIFSCFLKECFILVGIRNGLTSTFRWIKQHVASCSFLRTGWHVVCQRGARFFSVPGTELVEESCFLSCWGFSLVPCASWGAGFASFHPCCVHGLGSIGVPPSGHALRSEVGGCIIFVTPGDLLGSTKHCLSNLREDLCFFCFQAVHASFSETARSPKL